MATIDEILAAMPEPTAEGDHEFLTIDPVTRTINVPEAEKIFGVTGDELADRKYFICPRIVGDGLDLASMFIRVNFRNAGGEEDGYLVTDVAVSGDYITFSWQLWPKVAAYKGEVLFGVCADLPNTPDRKMPDWNTAMASGEVLEGLHPDGGDVEGETSDVVTQLRAETAAQTAAVEACGAAQVEAVEAAAAESTADAKAQIEAKGVATLATIPADYSTMAGKVNEQANAIKGHLSGEIVQAGDVSPVEHFLAVKVCGKNLFNIGALEVMPANYSVRISTIDLENNAFTITTADTHNGNGYCGLTNGAGNYAPTLRDVCPQMVAGRTYVLSGRTDSKTRTLYLRGVNKSWVFGTALAITEEHLSCKLAMYGLDSTGGEGTGACTISNIQIEEGTVATEYTPYIDPAGVTVTRCGKNLIDYKKPVLSYSIESTEINNGLHLAGRYMASFRVNIPAGATVAMSWNKANAEGSVVDEWRFQYADNTYSAHCKNGVAMVAQLPVAQVCLYVNKGDADGAADFTNIQLELGEAVTAYEPYKGATAMPDESGVVTGLPSLAPTMTLLPDPAGVNIECAYNRDTNAVLAEILEKIAALGG